MNVKNLKDMFEKKIQPTDQRPPVSKNVTMFDKPTNSNGVKQVSKVFEAVQKQQQKKSQIQIKPVNKINKNNDFLLELNKKLNNGPVVRNSFIPNQPQTSLILHQKKPEPERPQFIPIIQQPRQNQLSNELKNRMKSYRQDITVNQPKNDVRKQVKVEQNQDNENQTTVQQIQKPKNYFITDLEKMLNKNKSTVNKTPQKVSYKPTKTPQKVVPKTPDKVVNKTPEKVIPKMNVKPAEIPQQLLLNKIGQEQEQQTLMFSRVPLNNSANKKQPEQQINFNDIIGSPQQSQVIKSCLKRRFGRQEFRQTTQYQAQLAIFLKQLDKNQFQSRIYAQSQSKLQITNIQSNPSNKGSVRFQDVRRLEFKDNAYYSTLNNDQKLTRINFVINSVFKNTNREVVKGNPKVQTVTVANVEKIGAKQNKHSSTNKNQKNQKKQKSQINFLPESKPEQKAVEMKLSSRKSIFNNQSLQKQSQITPTNPPAPTLQSKPLQNPIQVVKHMINVVVIEPQLSKPLKKNQKRKMQNFDDA